MSAYPVLASLDPLDTGQSICHNLPMTKTFATVGAPKAKSKTVKLLPTVTVLENEFCRIEHRGNGKDMSSIYGADKTDQYNEPRFFTQNKRGLVKQWLALEAAFTPETKMYGASSVLREHGAKVHSYCAMD